ncbi:MAG: UbiD family decarboxylase [Verrucomicrobia bacterium]|nr:UbiD family decarboxylase [Verrucomicrobiota bacterium]
MNLESFLRRLKSEKELVVIEDQVDPTLELAEIHRRVVANEGPALFFANVKGSSFPVVTNLFGSIKRMELAFPKRPELVVKELIEFATRDFPPKLPTLWRKRKSLASLLHLGTKKGSKRGVTAEQIDPPNLEKLPLLKTWPEDGGHFITLPLVYTEPPGGGGHNLGMYRIQRFDETTAGLHFQIGKGGGFHYAAAEAQNTPLPVTIFLGGPPALMMSAIAPLPENVPELLLASFLQGEKISTVRAKGWPHPLISECEFALCGYAPANERRLEGPFGDHYGYYSLTHPFPFFQCKRLYHRKGAVYPATVVGKPRQEDFYIGQWLQKLLSPLFPVVMPGVQDLWSYGETGFHALSAAVVRERYYRECMASAFRILGEGQLSLTKTLLVTNQPVDLQDFRKTLTTILERFRPETDLFIFSNLSIDTLDYTGPELNKGSKAVFLGIGDPIRALPSFFEGTLKARPFCPGCLVVEGTVDAAHPDLTPWPLVIMVDSLAEALESEAMFLWSVFMRFEPAADISSAKQSIHRNHICYHGPIVIDARMKPSYPKVVECDPETSKLVTEKWANYFP